MTEEMGLREQKKRMTREAITAAAYELTVEKGVAEVTVEEIAREAFVSPRTVSNYFSSKEEAVLAARSEVTTQMVEEFCGKPSSVPPLETFREIVLDYARNQPDKLRRVAKMASLEEDNPTLRPYRVGPGSRTRGYLAGTDRHADRVRRRHRPVPLARRHRRCIRDDGRIGGVVAGGLPRGKTPGPHRGVIRDHRSRIPDDLQRTGSTRLRSPHKLLGAGIYPCPVRSGGP